MTIKTHQALATGSPALSPTLTRRAALAGALAATAALAVPVAGAVARDEPNPKRVSLLPGFAELCIGDRQLVIDTAQIPASRTVTLDVESDEFGRTVRLVTPDAGAEYAVLTHRGEIVVAHLVEGEADPRTVYPRPGFMTAPMPEGYPPGAVITWHVTVIGKVVG